jgi:hypothetical protein
VIDDDLRALLADRAGTVVPNARRGTEVRARIRTTRRRRTAGAALVLVLLAIAGLVLTRLPGRPDALPTGVPKGPWFSPDGTPAIPGFRVASRQGGVPPAQGGASGPFDGVLPLNQYSLQTVVVARCERAGVLVLDVQPGPYQLNCDRPVRGGFEGIVQVEPGPGNVRFEPDGQPGRWDIAVLVRVGPDRLPPPPAAWFPTLREGADGRDGGTDTVTIPRTVSKDGVHEVRLLAQCVYGVRLVLSVPAGRLAELTCDEAHGMFDGTVAAPVEPDVLDRLGLRPGQRVALTVESVGRRTDQWRLAELGP